jgi:glutamate 5-kinase
MTEIFEERGGGGAMLQADIDREPPGTETEVIGEQVEPWHIPRAQSERPVDIMKVGGKLLAYQRLRGNSVLMNDLIFDRVGEEIAADSGDIVLVTSAAISAGMSVTNLHERPSKETDMPELQRLSAVGRRHIENAWADAMPGREIGGLSLTSRELDDIDRREETLRVIKALFAHGEVPVVNENDAITHEEISFGSNDILAASLAARMQGSDLFGTVRLFLLTDVNGVYDRKPGTPPFFGEEGMLDPHSRIPVIENTADYRHLAGESDDELSIGGMASKFHAVDIAKAAGVDTWVYSPGFGNRQQAVEGEIGTYFPAAA